MRAPTLLLADGRASRPPASRIFEWPDIVHLEVAGIDLSINRVVLQMFLVVLLVWGLFYFAFRRPRLVPVGAPERDGVGRRLRPRPDRARGHRPRRAALPAVPDHAVLFVFFGNLGGVIPPVFFPLNGRMALPAIMAICSLLLFISVGISQQGLGPTSGTPCSRRASPGRSTSC